MFKQPSMCYSVMCDSYLPFAGFTHGTPREQDQSICLLSSVFAVSGIKLVEEEVERNV